MERLNCGIVNNNNNNILIKIIIYDNNIIKFLLIRFYINKNNYKLNNIYKYFYLISTNIYYN